MSRRIASLLFLVLATLAATTAQAEQAQRVFKRPAMAVKAQHKEAERARTIVSAGGEHIVAWKVGNQINVSGVTSQGIEGTLPFTTKTGGKVIGMTKSGKGAIVEIATPNGGYRYVVETIAGPRAHRTRSYDKTIAKRAYKLYEARQKSGSPGSAEGDWLQAIKDLTAK